jgi:hypothetical protein
MYNILLKLATLTPEYVWEVALMAGEAKNSLDFDKMIKLYLRQAREKLNGDLSGTREAIKLIAADKTRNFIEIMDRGLSKEEREYLKALIVVSMRQSFCYGYSIGKFEGNTNERIYL